MVRVAIVDDMREDAQTIECHLRRFGAETDNVYTTAYYSSDLAFLNEPDTAFDLIIMDIDMPDLNGVDAARQLRAKGNSSVLMFVTNFAQYALDGYEVEAVDYILKPVAYQDFALKLRKAQRYINQNRSACVWLRTVEGIVPVLIFNVLYVESKLHYLVYHSLNGDCRARGSMSDAEALMPSAHFAQCNISFLVNLQHVKAVERDEVLVGPNQIRLKISRGKRTAFLERLTRYLGGIDL